MLAEAILKRYPHLSGEEAHLLECTIKANRLREARKAEMAPIAEAYRRRSNFMAGFRDPGQLARMDSADPEGWQEFLRDSDKRLRQNDLNQGMTHTPPVRQVSTLEAVREYMEGFGWNGLTSPQVAAAIGRDKRGCDRALSELQSMGEVTVRETTTRGKNASRRKVWLALDYRPLVEEDNANPEPLGVDVYFEDTDDEHEMSWGAGGGRVVRPHGGAE